MVPGILKIDLSTLHRRNGVPGYKSLNEDYGFLISNILINGEGYSIFKDFFILFRPYQYPDLIENALIETPEYSWPKLGPSYCTFFKGPCDLDLDTDERGGELLHVRRNEILLFFGPFEAFYEVVPLLHFYQVLLLLSEKILELARQYGTVAYYQKVEPQHYNPNWEQEMVRLIGLLRERIAVERERDD